MICIVAHDAGGAEILSSYVRGQNRQFIYVLAGPAQQIFERKLGPVCSKTLGNAIDQCEWLLCGTSWQSDLEWQAIALARSMAKRSVAFLDHWVNYLERFVRNGERRLPDEIWVGDSLAQTMACEIFPEINVRLMGNPYFDELKCELAKMPHTRKGYDGGLNVLYVCEPISEHAKRQHGNGRHWGYTEQEALRYFLSNLNILKMSVNRILIRPHPSEAPNKYDWAKEQFRLPINYGGAKTLLEEVASCDLVVGCSSMALVVGLLAGKRVISCIPPGGSVCGLPQTEIESFQSLLASGINI